MIKHYFFLFGYISFFTLQSFGSNDNRVFEPEAIKEVMLKTAEWQIKHPKHAQNDWTNGAFYAGMVAAWKANGKRIFWSRGNGWVMGGLARILQELPADYPERPFYETLFKEMAERILSIQQEDGLWRASLLDPESYPGGEVSGSGFFCYAFAWGINNGLLDSKLFKPAVGKCWIALNSCVNEEGRVGWVQPIGADLRKNFSEDSWEVYGTGAFLLAGSEVLKLK